MRLSPEYFSRNLPEIDDPKLPLYMQGAIFQPGDRPLVAWDSPRAVNRLGYYIRINALQLALGQPSPYSTGHGLCPLCTFPYGSKQTCTNCSEYREHFQVLASIATYLTSAVQKDDFDVTLQYLLDVGPEARALILLDTTARSLAVDGRVIMFRCHARLQPGGHPGVNAVSREAPVLCRYLSFARSAASLDVDPRFGYLWDPLLRALSDQTLPFVNPRPAVFAVHPAFGPGPAAIPVGRVAQLENPPLPVVDLDVAAGVVNNFVAAWEHHHDLAIHDGRQIYALDDGPVARVEWPVPAPAVVPAGPAPVFVPGVPDLVAAELAPALVPPVPVPAFVPAVPAPMFVPAALAPRFVPAAAAPVRVQGPDIHAQVAQLHQQLAQLTQQLQAQQQHLFHAQQQVWQQQQMNPLPSVVAQPPVQVLHQHAFMQPYLHQPVGHAANGFGLNVLQQPGGPALIGQGQNIFGLQDFSYFPPTFSMNSASAAQLGKFATIAGASNTWTRRGVDSFPLKVQAYPRGNIDGVDSKPRSRVFDIPYATNNVPEQYVFITDEPTQLIQRENILECFNGNSRLWAQYILPLVGGDPQRMPVFAGSLRDVLANIHHLALGFGTQECVVLRVCHLISVQNIASCLTPGDAHTLLHPLDISSNYFQGALTKMISEHNRNRVPSGQQQGGRRQLALDGDAPARQEAGGRQRMRDNYGRANNGPTPPLAQNPAGIRGVGGPAQNNSAPPAPVGSCRRFWSGEACSYIQSNSQPCRYRHCCRTCQAVVPPTETAVHLRSHIV
jgi:hypothetical protein